MARRASALAVSAVCLASVSAATALSAASLAAASSASLGAARLAAATGAAGWAVAVVVGAGHRHRRLRDRGLRRAAEVALADDGAAVGIEHQLNAVTRVILGHGEERAPAAMRHRRQMQALPFGDTAHAAGRSHCRPLAFGLLLRLDLGFALARRPGFARLRTNAVAVEIIAAQRIHDLRRHGLRNDNCNRRSKRRQTRVVPGAVTDRQTEFAHRLSPIAPAS